MGNFDSRCRIPELVIESIFLYSSLKNSLKLTRVCKGVYEVCHDYNDCVIRKMIQLTGLIVHKDQEITLGLLKMIETLVKNKKTVPQKIKYCVQSLAHKPYIGLHYSWCVGLTDYHNDDKTERTFDELGLLSVKGFYYTLRSERGATVKMSSRFYKKISTSGCFNEEITMHKLLLRRESKKVDSKFISSCQEKEREKEDSTFITLYPIYDENEVRKVYPEIMNHRENHIEHKFDFFHDANYSFHLCNVFEYGGRCWRHKLHYHRHHTRDDDSDDCSDDEYESSSDSDYIEESTAYSFPVLYRETNGNIIDCFNNDLSKYLKMSHIVFKCPQCATEYMAWREEFEFSESW